MEMHIPRGRRHCVNKKILFCLCFFMFVFLFALWCFELCFVVLIASCLYGEHAFTLMLLCFIECMFEWSFALLYDHCSHFYMTVLVYDQVAHMFHIMFTLSQFTCYIILVLLLLALPWGSNVFCASVLGYRYIHSKFITAPMIHDKGSDMIREVFIFVLWVLYLFCTMLLL